MESNHYRETTPRKEEEFVHLSSLHHSKSMSMPNSLEKNLLFDNLKGADQFHFNPNDLSSLQDTSLKKPPHGKSFRDPNYTKSPGLIDGAKLEDSDAFATAESSLSEDESFLDTTGDSLNFSHSSTAELCSKFQKPLLNQAFPLQNQFSECFGERFLKDFDEFLRFYELKDVLGHGGFGYVREAIRKEDGSSVAVKVILSKNVQLWSHDDELGVIPTEIYILRLLQSTDHIPQDAPQASIPTCAPLSASTRRFSSPAKIWSPKISPRDFYLQACATAPSSETCPPGDTLGSSLKQAQESEAISALSSLTSPDKEGGLKSVIRGAQKIIQFIDIFEYNEVFLLVMEKLPNTVDLFEYIERYPNMGEPKANYIFRQVVEGISFCHSLGIFHRDIKDENVLLNEQTCEAKLIDFGSASFASPQLQTIFRGTKEYAAPEVLLGKKYMGESSEVWSLGILLFTLVFGVNPFLNEKESIMGKFRLPNVCSFDLECLLKSMLSVCANKRPTIQDVLNHPWMEIQGRAFMMIKSINNIIYEEVGELEPPLLENAQSHPPTTLLSNSEHLYSSNNLVNMKKNTNLMLSLSRQSSRAQSSISVETDPYEADSFPPMEEPDSGINFHETITTRNDSLTSHDIYSLKKEETIVGASATGDF